MSCCIWSKGRQHETAFASLFWGCRCSDRPFGDSRSVPHVRVTTTRRPSSANEEARKHRSICSVSTSVFSCASWSPITGGAAVLNKMQPSNICYIFEVATTFFRGDDVVEYRDAGPELTERVVSVTEIQERVVESLKSKCGCRVTSVSQAPSLEFEAPDARLPREHPRCV